MRRGARTLATLVALAALLCALAWLGLRERSGRALEGDGPERAAAIAPVAVGSGDGGAPPPAEGPRRGDARALRGRVVEHPAGRAHEGVSLRLVAGEEELAAAETDPEGRFVLSAVPREGCRLEVDPPPGLWVREEGLAVERRHWEGEELRVVLAPLERAPFRARVVDRDTGEEVPALELRVYGPDSDGYETVLSDARGRFATEGLLPAGEVRVEVDVSRVGRAMTSSTFHTHRPAGGLAAEQTVRAEVGPTYRLRLLGAGGL